MRIALLFPLVLLVGCSSDKSADDGFVTLDGSGGTAPVAAPAGTVSAATPTAIQAVDAEGSKLEPLLSSAISEGGLDSGACRFSPAQGALPVLVASKTGGKAFVSIGGKAIDVAPSSTVAQTGGSFAGEGVTLMVSGSGSDAAGSKATMQVSDADGPTFVYQDGFWACN